jgi:hypothetical protein
MVQVSLEEANGKLFDLATAAFRGETVVIQMNETSMIQLVPIVDCSSQPQFGSARGLIEMEDDFDAPLADFHEYMQ